MKKTIGYDDFIRAVGMSIERVEVVTDVSGQTLLGGRIHSSTKTIEIINPRKLLSAIKLCTSQSDKEAGPT